MKKTLSIIALFVMLPAGAALADDDCSGPRAQWQPREAAMRLAEENGWRVGKFEIDDGCYKIKGHDRDGRRIKAELDPATLRIVEMEYEDDDGEGDKTGRNPAPAGTVTPPQNGLFGSGAPPQVQVN